MAQFLINAGANVEKRYELKDIYGDIITSSSRNALEYAAEYGHVEIIQMLNIKKASTRGSALFLAAQNKHPEAVKSLLSFSHDNLMGALRQSVKDNNIEIARILLSAQQKAERPDAYKRTDYILNEYTVKSRRTLLMIAAGHGYAEIVKMLLDAKVDCSRVDDKGANAVHLLVAQQESTIMINTLQLLLDYCSEKTINAKIVSNDVTNDFNAFMLAIGKGNTKVMKMLIKKGATISDIWLKEVIKENGGTDEGAAIISLARHAQEQYPIYLKKQKIKNEKMKKLKEEEKEKMKKLKEEENEKMKKLKEVDSKWLGAAKSGDQKTIKQMIDNNVFGANIYDAGKINDMVNKALDIAAKQGQKEIVELMIKNGAVVTTTSLSSLRKYITTAAKYGKSTPSKVAKAKQQEDIFKILELNLPKDGL